MPQTGIAVTGESLLSEIALNPLGNKAVTKLSPTPETRALIELFQDVLWVENGLSENTLSAYRSDLHQFSLWLGEKSVLKSGPGDISAYLAVKFRQGASARTSARILSSLKRFFAYLHREGKVKGFA